MTWWEIVLAVWVGGSFPFAVLIGKAMARGNACPAPSRRTRAAAEGRAGVAYERADLAGSKP